MSKFSREMLEEVDCIVDGERGWTQVALEHIWVHPQVYGDKDVRTILVLGLMEMLEKDNPKFDRVKFIEACGFGVDTPVIEDVKI